MSVKTLRVHPHLYDKVDASPPSGPATPSRMPPAMLLSLQKHASDSQGKYRSLSNPPVGQVVSGEKARLAINTLIVETKVNEFASAYFGGMKALQSHRSLADLALLLQILQLHSPSPKPFAEAEFENVTWSFENGRFEFKFLLEGEKTKFEKKLKEQPEIAKIAHFSLSLSPFSFFLYPKQTSTSEDLYEGLAQIFPANFARLQTPPNHRFQSEALLGKGDLMDVCPILTQNFEPSALAALEPRVLERVKEVVGEVFVKRKMAQYIIKVTGTDPRFEVEMEAALVGKNLKHLQELHDKISKKHSSNKV